MRKKLLISVEQEVKSKFHIACIRAEMSMSEVGELLLKAFIDGKIGFDNEPEEKDEQEFGYKNDGGF